jgi:anti-anti-sigma regulatory factor
MLRVRFDHHGNGTMTVRLEGRLVGLYAEDARVTLARYHAPASILVDLSEVTFVDGFGERVLSWLGRLGAKFVAVNVYTRSVCERLRLEVSEQRFGSATGPDTQVLA